MKFLIKSPQLESRGAPCCQSIPSCCTVPALPRTSSALGVASPGPALAPAAHEHPGDLTGSETMRAGPALSILSIQQ